MEITCIEEWEMTIYYSDIIQKILFLFSQLSVWFCVLMCKLDLNGLTAYKKLPPNGLQGWFQTEIFLKSIILEYFETTPLTHTSRVDL